MKRIPLPVINDDAILRQVAGRRPVADCPHIDDDTETVRARYEAYVKTRGNPLLPGCPERLIMPGLLQNALAARYGSNAGYLRPIEGLRTNRTLNICPMCGLPGTGTLDHIFPESIFPELAIFSRNLVPACYRCNTKRKADYRGANNGERVFHPYFDEVLETRLVRATLEADNTFRTPDIGLESCLYEDNPLHPAIRYHIEIVLKRAGVIDDLIVFWADLQRLPRKEFSILPRGNFSDDDFNKAVIAARDTADQWHTTPNNWKSMLFEGLRVNPAAKAYLAQQVRELDADPKRAQDI